MPSRRLPLATLYAFEAAARLGSFRTAAAELHVTPAAVSHRIKALEAELDCRLFLRRARGVALTREGERYRERIAEAFALIERATAELDAPPIDGPLKVSVSRAFSRAVLLPHLKALLSRHPGLRLVLASDDRLADLHRGEADLAIRFGGGHYPGLRAEHLLGDAITVLGPADDPPATVDWRRARFIEDTGTTAAEPWSHWTPWWREVGLHVPADLERFGVSDSGLALDACRQGLGLCLARLSVAREAMDAGWVRPLLPWRRTEFAYHLVSLPGALASPRVAAFRDWLEETLVPLEREVTKALEDAS